MVDARGLPSGNRVIGLSPRVGEAFLQEFVKRLQMLQSPVLFGANLAQVFPHLDETRKLAKAGYTAGTRPLEGCPIEVERFLLVSP